MKNAHRHTKKARRIQRIPPSSEPSSEVALDDTNTDEPTSSAEEPATRKLPLTLTNDGRIDVPRLREKTRDALRHALSDPALPVALGINAPGESTASAEDAAILNQVTHTLFAGVSALSMAVAARAGFRPEDFRHLEWTADEIAVAGPLAAKIANKRLMPLLSEEWRDEIMLGYICLSILGKKIVLMRESAAHASAVVPVVRTEENVS